MQRWVENALQGHALWLVARILLVVVFASSGLAKLLDFQGGVAEMRDAGLSPPVLFNLLVIATLLLASAAILRDRMTWLACGALAVFLVLTIVLVHAFWRLPAPAAQQSLYIALEHVSIMGGLLAAAIASAQRRVLARL